MMRFFVKALLLAGLAIILFPFITHAQRSEGGTPAGFKFAPVGDLRPEVMPAINTDSLLQDDEVNSRYTDKPYRFGYNHIVNYNYNNSGRWVNLPSGDRLWQIAVQAPGAYSINLAFSNFHMPAGAKMYIYSADGSQLLGAFTAKNNLPDKFFAADLLLTDEVIVEYDEPQNVRGQGSFTLFRVTQGYKDITNYLKAFGDAGNCEYNINCSQFSAWATQKRAVVCLVSGGNEFCSGALVNNTANDGTPYVLTANHCGPADNTWVFRFNWEAPGCTNPTSSPSSQSISGCTTVANNATSDFYLVKMSSAPPSNYNVFYAGWTTSRTPATSVTGIHHPQGDIKKCSQANNAVSATSYNAGNGTAQVWQIGQWTTGVTEPGSSGSPLFDQNKRIIGQLYGGPSYCGATGSNLSDYYGRFCTSWDTGSTSATRLKEWLDPGNTGATTNDGYDPNAVSYTLDAGLSAITSPTGTTCNTIVSPVITIANHGTTTLTSATIYYHIDSGSDLVYNWSGSLTTNASANITLPTLTTTAGSHSFYVSVSAPNGGTDENTANDSINSSFTIIQPVPVNTPFTEGFEGSTFPPTGWTITTPTSGYTWERTTTANGFGTSTASAKVDEYSSFTSTVGEMPDLISPYINLSNVSTPGYLKFDVANARFNNTHYDSLAVLVSTNCGLSWTRIYAKGGASLVTASNTTSAFVPTSSQWRRDSININAYIGQPDVLFDFQLISGWGNETYIDNINIVAATPQNLDAALNSLTSPGATVCSNSVTPSLTLSNLGTTTLTTDSIYYFVDSNNPQLFVWTGSLGASQSTVVTLPATAVTTGSHIFTAYSASPNGGADLNSSNDTITGNFIVGANPVVSLGSDETQCGSDTIDAGNAGSTFAWNTNESTQIIIVSSTANYTVTVTNSSGCSASGSVNITINQLPSVALQLPVDTLCSDASALALSGGSPSGGAYSGSNVMGGMFDPAQSGTGTFAITYAYTDTLGCSASASANLLVETCTGIETVQNNIALQVYPNPFATAFTLKLQLTEAQTVTAALYSVDGKLLQHIYNATKLGVGTYTTEINTAQLSDGIYFLKLNNRFVKIEKLK
ncbi:MAG TPA: T9SS type A sorting domain-containing protein [Chitinophagales bacterium]|nr:T9SS type A sorting domain-containing protein [Chitinophagales bacterium]